MDIMVKRSVLQELSFSSDDVEILQDVLPIDEPVNTFTFASTSWPEVATLLWWPRSDCAVN